MLFFWRELERQVRIEGTVVKTTAAGSGKYFNVRPVQSRLSAIASQQSAPIADRAALESNYAAVAAAIGDARRRARNTGAATACSRSASNSGRAAALVSTTASSTRAGRTGNGASRLQP